MRWLVLVVRIVGWLLTPLVAWAASLWGAWLAFGILGGSASTRSSLYIAFGTAVVFATAALFLWMLLLRRSPRLRRSLHVTREGLAVIEEAKPEPSEVSAE